MRTYIKDLNKKIEEEVTIYGWIDVRRDHGKLIFIDLRDISGKVQMVILPKSEAKIEAEKVRPEWVVEVSGKVNKRPDNMVKPNELNGELEIEVLKIKILNEAKTPIFEIGEDGKDINEEIRMKHRYLDLRRERMKNNLKNRHRVIKLIRDKLNEENFIEVETPILTGSTPEGARDYLVPSRLEKGKFYALPQAPQQYKQLLMAGGIEKYFQIAKCMRDEDTRGDRQPEFTQLDMEMSFVDKEEIMKINEDLLIEIVKKIYPNKKIQQIPFPRITYKETMEKYKSDRPDIREDKNDPNLLAFCWIVDFPSFEKEDSGKWTFTHNPFSGIEDKDLDLLENKKDVGNIISKQYDVVLNGNEIGGGSIRSHNSKHLKKVFEIMDYQESEIEEKFGHMLSALESGTPPHGGIAWGLDRLIMILQGEESIREVIAFPKTGEGRDLLMNAPSEVSKEQLKELGIKIEKS